MTIAELRRRSVEVIHEGQDARGAYVASPTFPQYAYCWLRDGSFIADAMSRAGEMASAEGFFDWVARVVESDRGFDARYTLAGERDSATWPHRQYDGWGLWLWAMREHNSRHGGGSRWAEAAKRTEAELERVRYDACVDWWEEREGVHAATLACISAGLGDNLDLSSAEERLDGSLLVLPFLGFGGVDVSPLVSPGRGVHRHLDDVYYGGGEWLLLTALLGLAEPDRGRDCLDWIVAHAGPNGELPEQSQDHLLHPEELHRWIEKWGPPASPLLWSHAMFLTLAHEVGA